MPVVALMSGGLDSAVTLWAALAQRRKVVAALFLDYGQRAVEKEREASRRLCAQREVPLVEAKVTMPWIGAHALVDPSVIIVDTQEVLPKDAHVVTADPASNLVPLRNMVFASMGAALAVAKGATEMWVGWDWRPGSSDDKSAAFMQNLERTVLTGSTKRVRVVSPVFGLNRASVMRRAVRLRVPLSATWSCYNALRYPCGLCNPCSRRKEAAAQIGVDEDVRYMRRATVHARLRRVSRG